jgi:hypothetical protein
LVATAAADEVDNLQLVVGVERGGGPLAAGNYVPVVFDGDAIAFELEMLDEVLKRCRWGECGKFAGLAIEQQSQLEGKSITRESAAD